MADGFGGGRILRRLGDLPARHAQPVEVELVVAVAGGVEAVDGVGAEGGRHRCLGIQRRAAHFGVVGAHGSSEERRVGRGCVSTFSFRWSPYRSNTKNTTVT